MFDIGFSEILVIAVVALVVIGPERLPKTARTLGHLFGRLQRYVSDVKADISREIELDELRKLQREMQGAARDFEQTVTTAATDVKAGMQSVERELNEAAGAPAASAKAASSPADQRAASGGASSLPQPETRPEEPAERSRQAALPGFDKI